MPQSVLGYTRSAGTYLQDLSECGRRLLRRFDHACADVEHADLQVFVLRKIFHELDSGHVAVGVIQNELIDAGSVEEMRQHRLVAFGEIRAQNVVAPGVAEAEVPADFRLHAIAALRDDVFDPRVVVLVVGEQRQPRAQIFKLQILRAGGNESLSFPC